MASTSLPVNRPSILHSRAQYHACWCKCPPNQRQLARVAAKGQSDSNWMAEGIEPKTSGMEVSTGRGVNRNTDARLQEYLKRRALNQKQQQQQQQQQQQGAQGGQGGQQQGAQGAQRGQQGGKQGGQPGAKPSLSASGSARAAALIRSRSVSWGAGLGVMRGRAAALVYLPTIVYTLLWLPSTIIVQGIYLSMFVMGVIAQAAFQGTVGLSASTDFTDLGIRLARAVLNGQPLESFGQGAAGQAVQAVLVGAYWVWNATASCLMAISNGGSSSFLGLMQLSKLPLLLVAILVALPLGTPLYSATATTLQSFYRLASFVHTMVARLVPQTAASTGPPAEAVPETAASTSAAFAASATPSEVLSSRTLPSAGAQHAQQTSTPSGLESSSSSSGGGSGDVSQRVDSGAAAQSTDSPDRRSQRDQPAGRSRSSSSGSRREQVMVDEGRGDVEERAVQPATQGDTDGTSSGADGGAQGGAEGALEEQRRKLTPIMVRLGGFMAVCCLLHSIQLESIVPPPSNSPPWVPLTFLLTSLSSLMLAVATGWMAVRCAGMLWTRGFGDGEVQRVVQQTGVITGGRAVLDGYLLMLMGTRALPGSPTGIAVMMVGWLVYTSWRLWRVQTSGTPITQWAAAL